MEQKKNYSAWFRVRGIPIDQRSIKTIVKVGGLVGKTVSIDEKTRHKSDYIRVKIACRDIMQVPASAESALGLMLYDFFFEREVTQETQPGENRTGVRINSNEQPTPKKMRTDTTNMKASAAEKESDGIGFGKENSYRKHGGGHFSAPASSCWENKAGRSDGKGKGGKIELSW